MFLSRYSSQVHGIFRIMIGLLFLQHGLQKLVHFPPLSPAMAAMHVPDNAKPILLAAAIIETVTGILVTLGLWSRWAAFIASGEMAVGYFIGHVAMAHSIFPATNGGDAAVLFCFSFLLLSAIGPGAYAANQK
jgi:putative oxidoreductase